MVNKNILIVEDDEDLRSALCDILSEEGYQVVLAKNGADGLSLLKNQHEPFGLVILDWRMDIVDGRGFLSAIKDDESLLPPHVPILVMTAANSPRVPTDDTRSIRTMKKPIELDEFMSEVRRFFLDH